MEWIAYVACQDAVIKASVAKQSLVDDDQSKVYVASFVYFVDSRTSHPGMS